MGCALNHPKFDQFRIETYSDWGKPWKTLEILDRLDFSWSNTNWNTRHPQNEASSKDMFSNRDRNESEKPNQTVPPLCFATKRSVLVIETLMSFSWHHQISRTVWMLSPIPTFTDFVQTTAPYFASDLDRANDSTFFLTRHDLSNTGAPVF